MAPTPSSSTGQLPLRWAVILVAAVLAASLVGALTFVQTADWPATLLASIGAGGAVIPALHQILAK